jgi:amidase
MDCSNRSLGKSGFSTLTIDREKAQVSGDLDGDRIVGDVEANRIIFNVTDSNGRQSRYSATVMGDQFTGDVDAPDTNDPKARVSPASRRGACQSAR